MMIKSLACGAWRAFTDPGPGTPARMPAALARLTHGLQSLGLLAARLYVAQVFFLSGLTKIRDWSVTLALFEDEYHVPLLSPELAAYLGTAGELGLSALLALGLAGRFAAAGLSVVNVMAVLSLAEIAPAALAGHQLWGCLLLVIALWGAGALSADGFLSARFSGRDRAR
jgi:putative oxidoreductase